MRIALLTQYYPPETGAPQNRLSNLARRLLASGHEVVVLTAMPNYPEMKTYEGYGWKIFTREYIEQVKVVRSCIVVTKRRSLLPRLVNYFSFVFSSFWIGLILLRRQDILICESPPLFLGITGWLLAKAKRARFVMNISDLWPESAERLGIVENRILLNTAYRLEGFLYRRSALVTGQTQGICTDINQRFPSVNTFWFPNGVDPDGFAADAVEPTIRRDLQISDHSLVVAYGGIIGHAQGLDVIIRAAEKVRHEAIVFLIAGDGPEREELERESKSKKLDHVIFLGHLKHEQMLSLIASSDVALVPLRKLKLFEGAIPSKIFENLAMQKPLLLGVEGEAKELFIDRAKAGYAYEPENADDLLEKLRAMKSNPAERLAMGARGRAFVLEHFNSKVLAQNLSEQLDRMCTPS